MYIVFQKQELVHLLMFRTVYVIVNTYLNLNLSTHENTVAHKQCYIELKDLENRSKKRKQ